MKFPLVIDDGLRFVPGVLLREKKKQTNVTIRLLVFYYHLKIYEWNRMEVTCLRSVFFLIESETYRRENKFIANMLFGITQSIKIFTMLDIFRYTLHISLHASISTVHPYHHFFNILCSFIISLVLLGITFSPFVII